MKPRRKRRPPELSAERRRMLRAIRNIRYSWGKYATPAEIKRGAMLAVAFREKSEKLAALTVELEQLLFEAAVSLGKKHPTAKTICLLLGGRLLAFVREAVETDTAYSQLYDQCREMDERVKARQPAETKPSWAA